MGPDDKKKRVVKKGVGPDEVAKIKVIFKKFFLREKAELKVKKWCLHRESISCSCASSWHVQLVHTQQLLFVRVHN